jgi:predicted RND superfamily exporter protein
MEPVYFIGTLGVQGRYYIILIIIIIIIINIRDHIHIHNKYTYNKSSKKSPTPPLKTGNIISDKGFNRVG